jgi:hypothetical protein
MSPIRHAPEFRPRCQRVRDARSGFRRRFRPWIEGLEDRAVLSTLTVLNALDKGAGSLRDTIGHAQDGDTVLFAPALAGQTISLTSDELAIKKSLDIEGPGADKLAICGGDKFRVFDIVNQGLTVTIAGLTITHGRGGGGGVGSGGGGGAILNASSTLNVVNDVLYDNQAETRGGGITNQNGVLNATNTVFIGNQAIGGRTSAYTEGGAVWNSNRNSSATIVGCTFIGNRAVGANGGVITNNTDGATLGQANGGAIHSEGFTGQPSTLVVQNSTFIDNEAVAGNSGVGGHGAKTYVVDNATGGAIANDDGSILMVDGCVFSSNRAIGGSNATGFTSDSRVGHAVGGAVQNDGPATITNSSFDHNEALGGSNNAGGGAFILGRGAGGAIGSFSFLGNQTTLAVSACTFTDNRGVGGTGNAGGPFAGQGAGGAILNERESIATVTGSTFTGNQAIGGQGVTGGRGSNALGGALVNLFGSTLTVSGCTLTGNQAVGGSGFNGGNGFGGGLFNDEMSVFPSNTGTPAALIVLGSTITDNEARGGLADGGSAGLGEGGGLYLADGGVACLDAFTQGHTKNNQATSDHDDIFGAFTTCP